MAKRRVIGLMSGTSMDGLDICLADFDLTKNNHHFEILEVSAFDIPNSIYFKLQNFNQLTISEIQILHKQIGRFYADSINQFILSTGVNKESIDAIASHGQTVLHQPENGFTLQLGCGHVIAHHTKLNVINDFRSRDVVAGGQGAPLVPIGDFGLFSSKADCFLNIGGFSNISYRDESQQIKAYDISPANLPLNKFIQQKGESFDRDGVNAASGRVQESLLIQLNNLAYYHSRGPKSLGTEWLDAHFYPCFPKELAINDCLATITEHCAYQIGQNLDKVGAKNVLASGGGVRNKFLLKRIKHHFSGNLLIPDEQLIDYKEALIFGYLGALYLEKLPNALRSVTGAQTDTINGTFYLG